MTTSAEYVARRLAGIPDVARMTGVFVGMDGPRAVVNVGSTSVTIPCIGFTPPVPGMTVQLERRNGQLAVFGPAVALPAMGEIKAGGSPKCTVTVGGKDYVLGYRDGYVPVVGDSVEVNWATGIIQGKVTVSTPTKGPGANPNAGAQAFSGLLVQAEDSGTFGSSWFSNDVRASDSLSGAWFYGPRIQDALRGAAMSYVEIFLPATYTIGECYIASHTSPSKPGGFVDVGTLYPLNPRSDWVPLPLAFATYLRDNPGGIAVTSGNGDNQWTGRAHDEFSGALRFAGVR